MNRDNLLLPERHAVILEELVERGRVLAPELAEQLKVSEDTIRRDLRDMAAAGLCRKVYGGAVRVPSAPFADSLIQRRTQLVAGKSQLACAAVTLLRPGTVVFIDAGSTNICIAEALPDISLTVATNSPAIAAILAERSHIDLIVIGGAIDKRSSASVGAAAIREVESLRPDLYILGACGVHAQTGVSAFHFEEAEFKRRVGLNSRATLIAATTDKLGTAAPFVVAPIARLAHLIVEAGVQREMTAPFTASGVRVVHAGGEP